MLLDEDPAVLIHECIGNFNINPDRAALTRISGSLSTLSESRALRLGSAQSSLKKVSRQLTTLEQQHALTVSAHNPTEHASAILALDAQKFRLAKEASAAEIESERLDGELRGCEVTLSELDKAGVDGQTGQKVGGVGGNDSDDQTILKLKLYRSLGIDAEPDANGQYRRAVVRNSRKGTARVVDIDPQFSRSFYANHFWQAL